MEDFTDEYTDPGPSTNGAKIGADHIARSFERPDCDELESVPGPSTRSQRYYFDEFDHEIQQEFKHDIWSQTFPVYRDLPPELQPLPIGCKNIIIQVSDKPETDQKTILIGNGDTRIDFNEKPNPENPEEHLIEIVSPKPLDKLIAEFKFNDTKDVEHVEITMEVGKDVKEEDLGEIVWIDNNQASPYKRFDMDKLHRADTYLFQQYESTLMTTPNQIEQHCESEFIADSDPFLGMSWGDLPKVHKPSKEEERLLIRGLQLTDSPGQVRCKKRKTHKRNPFRNKAFRNCSKIAPSDRLSLSSNYPESSSSWGTPMLITHAHTKVQGKKRKPIVKASSTVTRPQSLVARSPRHYDPFQSPWNDLQIVAQPSCSNQNYSKKREERKYSKANSTARKQGQFYTNRTAYARENLLPGCSRTDFTFIADPYQNRANRNKSFGKTSYASSANASHYRTDMQTPFTTKCIHGNYIFPPYSDALKRSNIVNELQDNPETSDSTTIEAKSNDPNVIQTPDLSRAEKSRDFNYNIHNQICRLDNDSCHYCNVLRNYEIEATKGANRSYGDDLIGDDTLVKQFSSKESSCPYCELLWYNQSFNERGLVNKAAVLSLTDGGCSPSKQEIAGPSTSTSKGPTYNDVGVQCSEQDIIKSVAAKNYRQEEGNVIIVDEIDEDFEYEEIPSNVTMKTSQENGKSLLEVFDGKFAGVYHKVQNLRGVDGAILLVGVNNKDPVYYIDESLISQEHCNSTDRLYLLEMYAGNDEYKYSVVMGDGRHFGVQAKHANPCPQFPEEQICSVDLDH